MKLKIPKGIKIIKKIDWSKVDFILCNRTGYFPDDVKGHCDHCNAKIVYRPYQPKDVKKLCMTCANNYAKD